MKKEIHPSIRGHKRTIRIQRNGNRVKIGRQARPFHRRSIHSISSDEGILGEWCRRCAVAEQQKCEQAEQEFKLAYQ